LILNLSPGDIIDKKLGEGKGKSYGGGRDHTAPSSSRLAVPVA